jgi:HK97 family phage portal protein
MMTQEQADRLKEAFTKRHGGVSRSHAIGVLSGGAAWTPLSVRPDEAQFLETRRYSAAEIANLYGVPVELVGDGGTQGAKGYVTGVAMRFRLWYLTGLLPRITRLETALSSCLPRPAYVKFNTNALLRMDPAERTAFYQAAQLGEWMSRNEIRALEDMDPVEGGDEFLHSVQWQENAPPDGDDTDESDEGAEGALFDGGDDQ